MKNEPTVAEAVASSKREVTVEAESLAKRFHEAYERLAPEFGYETRTASAVPWADVPIRNRNLMIAVCAELIDGAISDAASALSRKRWADLSVEDRRQATSVASRSAKERFASEGERMAFYMELSAKGNEARWARSRPDTVSDGGE